jgi:hypothetical protein
MTNDLVGFSRSSWWHLQDAGAFVSLLVSTVVRGRTMRKSDSSLTANSVVVLASIIYSEYCSGRKVKLYIYCNFEVSG